MTSHITGRSWVKSMISQVCAVCDGKVTYDETRRRTKPRRPPSGPRPVYLERGNGRGAKRTAIVLGPAAIERIVGGRYEWRDAGFKRPRNAGR